MENTRETASVCGNSELAAMIATGHGFELYKQYNEKQVADLIGVHPNTVKKARQTGNLAYLQKGERAIAYFGFQIAEYLITNIQSCQNQKQRKDIKSETIGYQSKPDQNLGAVHGTTPKLDKQSAVASARRILKKPNKS